jgi:hypothetical protein
MRKCQQAELARMRHAQTDGAGPHQARFAVGACADADVGGGHTTGQLPQHQSQHRARCLAPLALFGQGNAGVFLPLGCRQMGLKILQAEPWTPGGIHQQTQRCLQGKLDLV